jgi:hypothetical protein
MSVWLDAGPWDLPAGPALLLGAAAAISYAYPLASSLPSARAARFARV